MIRALLALCVVTLAPIAALGAELPAHLDLAAPFPAVTFQSAQIEHVAAGIDYADYEILSADGPISVHVLAAALNNPDVRAGAVLSSDTIVSGGETVSSMAQRTGAVGGINGDYFDIGRTNSPTNIVVRGGQLLRTPRKRYALALLRSGGAHFAEFTFAGTVQMGTQSLSLGGVNTMPTPDDAITLITPDFGAVPPQAGVTLAGLTLASGSEPFGTYRVTAFTQSIDGSAPPGYYLAVNSQEAAALPNIGDTVAASGTLSPIPLRELYAAIGGGPLILYNGAWFDDPDGPSGGEFDRRIPCSGVAIQSDGTLLLIEVDGRQEERSIGLTRPQFAALMIALGANNGMALDGGGSSEMAARLLGERQAQLASAPSDGSERRVADGIFLYDDAPAGPASSIAASPQAIHALSGAEIDVHTDEVDASERPVESSEPIVASVEPATLGTLSDGRFVAAKPGDGRILLTSGNLRTQIPVEVVAEPAHVVLLPSSASIDANGSLLVQARAFDDLGNALALPAHLHWMATNGTIDDRGHFVAGKRSGDVALVIGGRTTSMHVVVGMRELSLLGVASLRFMSIPQGGAGSAQPDPSCADCIRLVYYLGADERAAYAIVERVLPQGTVGLSFDIDGDASGAELRIALRNATDGQVLVTARVLDSTGKQHVVVRFPPGIVKPVRLVGFYVIATRAQPNPSGAVVIGNVRAMLAGTQ